MAKKFFRVNQQIQSKSLRVIDATGKQIGILTLEKALKLATDVGLDLVEIAPNARPSVAKIINFKKFLFEQEIKERKVAKKVREVETKEIRVGPFISDHDLQTRINQARNFLAHNNNFKLTIQFRPRQMQHPEFGQKTLDKVKQELSGIAQVVRGAKWEGRRLSIIFGKSAHAKT